MIFKLYQASELVVGAVAAIANAIITASAVAAAAPMAPLLPAVAGQTNFITGFQITGGGATAASVIVVTLTGLVGGTRTYDIAVPAGAALGITPLVVEFSEPIPATGPNVAITLNVPSFGAGNTNAAATLEGFLQGIAAVAANLPPDKQVESRTRYDSGKPSFIYGWNHSPFAFEIQEEGANPLTIAQPFAPYIQPINTRTEKLIFHAVAQQLINLPIAAAQYAVYWTVSEFKPELIPGPW